MGHGIDSTGKTTYNDKPVFNKFSCYRRCRRFSVRGWVSSAYNPNSMLFKDRAETLYIENRWRSIDLFKIKRIIAVRKGHYFNAQACRAIQLILSILKKLSAEKLSGTRL